MLLDLYDRGMCEPLPLAARTSAAYVARRRTRGRSGSPIASRRRTASPSTSWSSGPAFSFAVAARATPPRDDELWMPGETTRFGQYAHRLWGGLLRVEAVDDQ